jgi:hypothetical protein
MVEPLVQPDIELSGPCSAGLYLPRLAFVLNAGRLFWMLCCGDVRNFRSSWSDGEDRECVLFRKARHIVTTQQVVSSAVAEFENQILKRCPNGNLDAGACVATGINRPLSPRRFGRIIEKASSDVPPGAATNRFGDIDPIRRNDWCSVFLFATVGLEPCTESRADRDKAP